MSRSEHRPDELQWEWLAEHGIIEECDVPLQVRYETEYNAAPNTRPARPRSPRAPRTAPARPRPLPPMPPIELPPFDPSSDEWVHASAVAKLLGVKTATLGRWRREGKGPPGWAKTTHTTVYYRRLGVTAFLRNRVPTEVRNAGR